MGTSYVSTRGIIDKGNEGNNCSEVWKMADAGYRVRTVLGTVTGLAVDFFVT